MNCLFLEDPFKGGILPVGAPAALYSHDPLPGLPLLPGGAEPDLLPGPQLLLAPGPGARVQLAAAQG